MTPMHPAIVVNAYKRPRALARLLASLQQAEYPAEARVSLVISVDHGGSPEVRRLAEEFKWRHGQKQLIFHEQHLGLVEHFLACGNLTQDYESILYLEDDLAVSPVLYAYAMQALDFYKSDERIAGFSLYALWFNGYTQQPFVPLPDGSDVFFVQVPYTQGLAVTESQWSAFTAWRNSIRHEDQRDMPLHESWSHFAPDDWFPQFTRFLVSTGRFFVHPRVSLTTGCGDAGEHFSKPTTFFQAPLQRAATEYRFRPLDESVAVYDSFFEMRPDRLNRLTDRFRNFDYELDLYATKSRQNLRAEYALTSRRCRHSIAAFGKEMWPLEANVIEGVPGDAIYFGRTQDLQWDRISALAAWRSNYEFFTHNRVPGIKIVLKLTLARLLSAAGRRTMANTEPREQDTGVRETRELTP